MNGIGTSLFHDLVSHVLATQGGYVNMIIHTSMSSLSKKSITLFMFTI